MTVSGFQGSWCRIDGISFTVHWMEPDRIVLKTGDPRSVKPDESRPGFWFSASSNPDSANYDPNNFNRLAGILREHGEPAPEAVDENDRHLDRRPLSARMRARILRNEGQ